VVVLDEVSNEPLVLGLLLKEDSETKGVEEPPSEGVQEVRDEERSTGEGGEEHGTESVGEEEDEREVGGSARGVGGRRNRRRSEAGARNERDDFDASRLSKRGLT